jgi:lipopolysaccharide/colanic/teichoic acid biosynthesis glycosyltransferase
VLAEPALERLRGEGRDRELARDAERLLVRPGLTGLAQIRLPPDSNQADVRRKLAYDLHYLRQRSMVGEIKLVLATLPKIWDRSAL